MFSNRFGNFIYNRILLFDTANLYEPYLLSFPLSLLPIRQKKIANYPGQDKPYNDKKSWMLCGPAPL